MAVKDSRDLWKNDPEYELGKVVDIEQDRAVIELDTKEACQHCQAQVICQPDKSGRRILRLKNTLGARVGDLVRIESSDRNHIILAFLQYGLPLASFVLTIFMLNIWVESYPWQIPLELGHFILGLLALLVTGLGIRWLCGQLIKHDFAIFELIAIEKSTEHSSLR